MHLPSEKLIPFPNNTLQEEKHTKETERNELSHGVRILCLVA